MKQKTHWAVAFLAGTMVLAPAPAAVHGAGQPGFETYVVRRGDTLSGIAGRVFGDVKRWREILTANPQVTNPNRIYPGDSLLVPVPETATGGKVDGGTPAEAGAGQGAEAAAAPTATPEVTQAPAVDTAVPDLPVEKVHSVPVVNPALYRSAGYIADGLPAIAIVATEDDRLLVATYDAAIINAPVSPGSRFTVVRVDRRVFHPLTGQYLGWMTRVLGTAEVTCRDLTTSTVTFLNMRDAAGVGDYLVPFDPNDTLEENLLPGRAKPECVAAGIADGVIVAFDEDRLIAGEQEFAYIDRGASCVVPGKRLTIYRETAREGRTAIGELLVLRAGGQTSTALITTSLQEVGVGDLLRAR